MYRLGHAVTGIMPEQTYGNKKVLVVLRGCVTTCDCYNSEMIVVQPTSFDCLSVCLFVCLSLSAHFAISPAHPFIPQCICLSTHLPSLSPTHPSLVCLCLPTCHLTHPPTHPSLVCLSTHLPSHPPTHPSLVCLCLSTHLPPLPPTHSSLVCLCLSTHLPSHPPPHPSLVCLSTHLPSLPPTHPTVSICLYLLIHPLATSPVHQSSPLPVCPSTFHCTVLELKLFLPVCVCVFCLYSCLRDWCLRVLCFRAGMDAVLRSNSHVALDHFPVELCEVLFLLLTFSFLYI